MTQNPPRRRAAEPGTVHIGRVDDQQPLPWRDRIGSDMHTQTGMSGTRAVLICIPTHEIHAIGDDGTTSINTWSAGLRESGFQLVDDLHLLEHIRVSDGWTVELGPATPREQYLTVAGTVHGPFVGELRTFYEGEINTVTSWLDAVQAHGSLVLLAQARDGAEDWAIGATVTTA
jgi:hypothetical protein